MRLHHCTDCGKELPKDWRPVATRTVEAVCPECAFKHMRTKSRRRKAMAEFRQQEKSGTKSVAPV